MTGIVVSGIGFGILIIPPLASQLISTYDWRSSYLIIGIIALVLILLAAQFLRQNPGQIGQLPYGENEVKQESSVSEGRGVHFQEAVRTKQFWIVCTIYFCFGFGLHTIMVHIVPHATDLGISAANAANILAMIGGAGIVGSITMGSASDRIGIKPSLIFTLILMLAALLWLQLAKELWMLYLFGIAFGLACRSIIALQSLVTAELFGLSSLGILVGSVAFIYTIGAALGPALSGHIFDITGSYSLAFLADAILVAIALILALLLRPLRSEGGENETRRRA